MVEKLDLGESTRSCQVGFDGRMKTAVLRPPGHERRALHVMRRDCELAAERNFCGPQLEIPTGWQTSHPQGPAQTEVLQKGKCCKKLWVVKKWRNWRGASFRCDAQGLTKELPLHAKWRRCAMRRPRAPVIDWSARSHSPSRHVVVCTPRLSRINPITSPLGNHLT
jgi:hypothetical protein